MKPRNGFSSTHSRNWGVSQGNYASFSALSGIPIGLFKTIPSFWGVLASLLTITSCGYGYLPACTVGRTCLQPSVLSYAENPKGRQALLVACRAHRPEDS